MALARLLTLSALATSAFGLPHIPHTTVDVWKYVRLHDAKVAAASGSASVAAAAAPNIVDGVLIITTTVTVTKHVAATPAANAGTNSTQPSINVPAPAPAQASILTVSNPPANTPAAATTTKNTPPVVVPVTPPTVPTTTQAPAPAAAPATTAAAAPAGKQSGVVQASPQAATAGAAAVATTAASSGSSSGSSSLSGSTVLAIIPNAASCANPPKAGECITAADAAPFIAASFAKYNINNKGAQAALISLMGFESGDLKYNVNLENTSQGTRNMMMATFITQYAASVLGSKATGNAATDLQSLNADETFSSGSAAWYMSTKCPDLVAQFATDPDTAWTTYNSQCIGLGSVDPARTAYFTRAKTAFGIA